MSGRTGRADSSTKPSRRVDAIPGPWSSAVENDWSPRLGSPGEFVPAPRSWPRALRSSPFHRGN